MKKLNYTLSTSLIFGSAFTIFNLKTINDYLVKDNYKTLVYAPAFATIGLYSGFELIRHTVGSKQENFRSKIPELFLFSLSALAFSYGISQMYGKYGKETFARIEYEVGQEILGLSLLNKLSPSQILPLYTAFSYAISLLTVKYIAPFLNKICRVRSEEEILRDQLAESRRAHEESRQALTQSQEEIRRRSGARRELENQLAESRQALEESRRALAESRVVRASRSSSPRPQLIGGEQAAGFLPLAAASAAPAPAPEAAARSVRSSRSASLVRVRSGGDDATSAHPAAAASTLTGSRVEPLALLQMPQIQQQQQQIQQPPSPIAVASRSRSGSDDASVHPAMDIDQSGSDRLSGFKRAGGELTRPREESVRQIREGAIFRSASPLVSSSSSSSAAAAAASAAAAHDRNPCQELIESLRGISAQGGGDERVAKYKQAMEIALRGDPAEGKIKEALEYYARIAEKNAARTLAAEAGFDDRAFGERLDMLNLKCRIKGAAKLAREISSRADALISGEEIASAASATLSGQQQQAQMPSASVPQTPARQSHRSVSSHSESGLFTGRGTVARTARRVVDALSVVREAADEGDSGARGVLAARPRPSVGTLEVVARSLVPDFQSERNPQTQRRSSRR